MERSRNESMAIGGSMTALVTPFHDGAVDWACLDRLVDRQIEQGTDWLVALGTTGETPTLTTEEREKLVERVVVRASGKCRVMVGTGSNNTADAICKTQWASSHGADAVLVVTPSYNKPTQEGMFRHFAAVAESVEVPIVLYNVPARTGVHLDNDTIVRLRTSFAQIVAIKDATGRVDHLTELQRRCDIRVLCGDDVLTWPSIALGAVGVVSVLGNLCPSLMRSLVRAALDGNMEEARKFHNKVDDLAGGIGRFGPNPIPIKTAMAIVGLLEEEFRLPLCPMDANARLELDRVLRRHEILEPVPV